MKIGIIGPLDSCNKVASIMNESFPQLTPLIYGVSKAEESYLEIEKSEKECDGLIFTGMGVYFYVINKRDINLPYLWVPYMASSIMKAFWELRNRFPDKNHVSIDVVEKAELNDILEDLELDHLNVELKEFNHLFSENDYLDFHIAAHEKNENNVSIVGFGWVYERIKNMGYPCIRLYSTKSVIKNTISDLVFKINEARIKHANLAVQLIHVEANDDISQYRKLEISSLIQSKLIGYLKGIQGSIFSLSWNRYLIFSTKGAVENNLNLVRLKNILDYMKKEGIYVYIGTGLGMTAYESEINAERALEAAIEYGYSSIYKVEENKIEGPLLQEDELRYDFMMPNEEIEKLAEKVDLNPIYIHKINSIKEIHKKDTFTSEELAKYLDVSLRTANRIVKKILESNCGKEVGLESNRTVGRPKKIIKIDFNIK